MSDLNYKVQRLVIMRQNYRAIKDQIEELESDIAADMEDRQLVIPGIGMVQRKARNVRTKWDHDAVYSAINRYVAESPMGEDDILRQAAQFGVSIMQRLANPSWRTTKLREIDIDPDEYCHKEQAGYQILITEGIEG